MKTRPSSGSSAPDQGATNARAAPGDVLEPILDALLGILRGEYDPQLTVEAPESLLDAIHLAINAVGEELVRRTDVAQQILGAMADFVIVAGVGGRIQTVNEATWRALGFGERELVGSKVDELVKLAGDTSWERFAADDQPAGGVRGELAAKVGRPIPVVLKAAPVSARQSGTLVIVAQDLRETLRLVEQAERSAIAAEEKAAQLELANEELTRSHRELKEAQAKMIESGKLAALGELAAGVAHEMNNPLSGVLTYSILLDEKVDQLPAATQGQLGGFSEHLQRITAAAERCKAIADNLLAFARQSEAERGPVDLAEICRRTVELLGAQLRKSRIAVTVDVPELSVWGSVSQLQQVLTNIILNAIQAMRAGGSLSLSARPVDGGAEFTIADSGAGIPQEHHGRVFDPFFTTKPVGKGTGLGLSIAYGIVESHGGEITFDSLLGQGTTFRVRLPAQPPLGRED